MASSGNQSQTSIVLINEIKTIDRYINDYINIILVLTIYIRIIIPKIHF